MSAKMSFSFSTSPDASERTPAEVERLSLSVVGNFSGRPDAAGLAGLGAGTSVDFETLEQTMERIAPSLTLTLGGDEQVLEFTDLDSFHPDQLFAHVPALAELTSLRRRLRDPSSQSTAASELAAMMPGPTAATGPEPVAAEAADEPKGAQTLADLLGGQVQAKPSAPVRSGHATLVDSLLRRAVQNEISAAPDASVDTLMADWCIVAASRLSQILHAPEFQELERNWSALAFLLSHLESTEDRQVQVRLLDIPSSRFSDPAVLNCVLAHLVGLGDEGVKLGILARSASTVADTAAIKTLFEPLARKTHSRWFLGASIELCREVLENARNSRDVARSPEQELPLAILRASTPHFQVIGPAFLVRQPYGPHSEPIDAFEFREQCEPPVMDRFLWGSSAVLAGLACSNVWGGSLPVGNVIELDDLPVYAYTQDGESHAWPCTQAWISREEADLLAKAGIGPVQSVRHRDAVFLPEAIISG